MKAIMISGKPKWSAKIANGNKTIEVRTSKALANAIQKLIDKYGYADIYWYCTKDNHQLVKPKDYDKYLLFTKRAVDYSHEHALNGKVVFKFRCYKVEEIIFGTVIYYDLGFFTYNLYSFDLYEQSCLTKEEMQNYLKIKSNGLSGYAIYISDLEIFDEPKELIEFKQEKIMKCDKCKYYCEPCFKRKDNSCLFKKSLTKAPQNMVYVEVEK